MNSKNNICEAKFGDENCKEKATKLLGNYGQILELCPKHYKLAKKQLELNYHD